ncbi:hypothetical protein NDU88_006685 [Pleurodeles waltl]|uniref:Uncharacterized protein n=1 Tax=Pleurodeles waltl TaxID=8319 RepID=A0AAV7WBA8_PLEWA|nr:hypothetical protein NDU88_006685 [Pleurodeles waltl]
MRGWRRREWVTPEQTGPGVDRGPVVRRTRHREPGYRCTDSGSATSEGSAETQAPEEVGLGAALGRRGPVPMGAPNAMGTP